MTTTGRTKRTTKTAKKSAKKTAPHAAKKTTAKGGASAGPDAAAKKRAQRIYKALEREYPDAHCELEHEKPHELLIATILSAQATDVSVNKATPALFRAFPSPQAFAKATPAQIEPYISTIGLYRNKAKFVQGAMKKVVEEFGGKVPETMEGLLSLPGVARKTANVVLGNAFNKPEGVVVDTHVARLVQRFGLSTETDPKKIERDLMALFPKEQWTMLSHLLIFHGRRVCKARGGTCSENRVCREFCEEGRKG